MFVVTKSTVLFYFLLSEYLKREYDVILQKSFLLLFYIYIILGLLSQEKNIKEENLKTGRERQYWGSRRESYQVMKRVRSA